MSLSDFDQQASGSISTINNKHYQFHNDYDENSFNNGNENSEAMQSALNRGPYFDISASRNVTALVGSTAYLNCRVKNLGNKTVSWGYVFLCIFLLCFGSCFCSIKRFIDLAMTFASSLCLLAIFLALKIHSI